MKRLLLIVIVFYSCQISAQEDSSVILSYDDFIRIVHENHPLGYQAKLQSEKGDAGLLQARGAFDPKLDGNADQKYYKGEQYYSTIHGGLKIPTWFGLTAQGGYEINDGTYLNPSSRVPDDGLWYAGLSLTLGKGLLIDERRAELKQAKIYQESAEFERKLMLNQLLFDASVAYWDWYSSYHQTKIYEVALANAQQRFEGIKQSVLLGDRPFIDTLEAGILVQNRAISLTQLELDYLNNTNKLSIYLWQEGFIPLELNTNTVPLSADGLQSVQIEPDFQQIIDSVVINHPQLLIYQNKIESKSIDLRLKKQGLLPSLDLKYNFLSEPLGPNVFSEVNASDYNWGLQFSYPILTRKERGTVRLTEIELDQVRMESYSYEQEIEFKIKRARNNLEASSELLRQYKQIAADYTDLFNAENELFGIGESSLFLLISRESVMLDAQLKSIDYQRKNQLSKNQLDYQLVRLAP
jgi:outer membrane protein TolC